jgi:hypothetical protein
VPVRGGTCENLLVIASTSLGKKRRRSSAESVNKGVVGVRRQEKVQCSHVDQREGVDRIRVESRIVGLN